MTERINPKWLQPIPDYWQEWSYRDDERIAIAPPFVPDPTKPEPVQCEACGAWMQAEHYRKFCPKDECQAEKVRRHWARARDKRRGKK